MGAKGLWLVLRAASVPIRRRSALYRLQAYRLLRTWQPIWHLGGSDRIGRNLVMAERAKFASPLGPRRCCGTRSRHRIDEPICGGNSAVVCRADLAVDDGSAANPLGFASAFIADGTWRRDLFIWRDPAALNCRKNAVRQADGRRHALCGAQIIYMADRAGSTRFASRC